MEKEINIAKTEVNDIWKFKHSETRISEIEDIKTLLMIAVHCHKRIYHYFCQIHYFDYKIKTCLEDNKKDFYSSQKEKCSEIRDRVFSKKLSFVAERYLALTGENLPKEYETIKNLLSEYGTKKDEHNGVDREGGESIGRTVEEDRTVG